MIDPSLFEACRDEIIESRRARPRLGANLALHEMACMLGGVVDFGSERRCG